VPQILEASSYMSTPESAKDAPEAIVAPSEPPFGGPIGEINANLESLRDFVDTLGEFLASKRAESISAHEAVLIPLLLALDETPELPENPAVPKLTAKQREALQQRFPDAGKAEVTRNPSGGVSITLQLKDGHDPGEAVRDVIRAMGRTQMLYSSSLMNLASAVELFFSKLLHLYFARHPEAIGTKEKSFSFDDLSAFGSIADARAHYVLSRIEDLLRGSLADWLGYARSSIKLSMGYLKEDLTSLEETFQRRNLVVHNSGRVNSIYLSKVSEEFRKRVKVGDDLSPDREYLHRSIDMWERACLLIGAELWKQLAPDDAERAGVLTNIAFKHLKAGRWRIAESLSDFIMRDKHMPESALTSAQLNYWQARKRCGQWESVRDEVERADYSAKSDLYQLARLSLLERNDDFFSLLPRALQSGALDRSELTEWPVFADVRGDERYREYAPEATGSKPKRRRAAKRVAKRVSSNDA